jgi:NAD(P)-dependent dehydrogenase (short-subunit alcohol dehydrogenase family)
MASSETGGAVLVTGASTGIGRATALELDLLGYCVFASVRNLRDADDLQAQASQRLKPVLLDVTDGESIIRLKDQIEDILNGEGLAGLVNNAGMGTGAPLEFIPMDEMRRLFEVNLFGLLAVSQAFLPLLRQANGRIVNISSTASLLVMPFHGPYSASKLSVNGLTDALRLEVRPHGVHVSLILCGSIQTPIWEKGSRNSRQLAKKFPPQAWELYGPALHQIGRFFAEIGRSGRSPQAAARVIVRALMDRHPRNTYLVGPDAVMSVFINKLLPGRLRDWVLLKMMGLGD